MDERNVAVCGLSLASLDSLRVAIRKIDYMGMYARVCARTTMCET